MVAKMKPPSAGSLSATSSASRRSAAQIGSTEVTLARRVLSELAAMVISPWAAARRFDLSQDEVMGRHSQVNRALGRLPPGGRSRGPTSADAGVPYAHGAGPDQGPLPARARPVSTSTAVSAPA